MLVQQSIATECVFWLFWLGCRTNYIREYKWLIDWLTGQHTMHAVSHHSYRDRLLLSKLTLCPKFDGSQSHSESLGIRDQMKDFVCYSATCSHISIASILYRCILHSFHIINNLNYYAVTPGRCFRQQESVEAPVLNASIRSSKFIGKVTY